MIDQPFALFRPWNDRLRVAFFDKSDPDMTNSEHAAKIDSRRAAALHQKHGNKVMHVSTPTERTIEADGMMTKTPGLALMIRVADCQSFAIYVPEIHLVGMIHVGWRGLETDIIGAFYDQLREVRNINPRESYVGAGPSLCKKCAEFTDPATEMPHFPHHLIDGKKADLMQAADERFLRLGVARDHFERMPGCTCCDPKKYWTYRGGDREAVKEGKTNVLAAVLL